MTIETIAWIWIISGAVLMLAEFILPGLVAVFLGAGSLIVGSLMYLGIITGIASAFLAWIGISLILVLTFRKFALKIFPPDSSYQLVEDDVDAMGTIVDVVKRIEEKNNEGRITYSGTSWPAISNKGEIEVGEKARLLYRDNISWVVEPCSDDE